MIHTMKFGQSLQELLLLRGWSAAQLAKILNIDASYVRRWIQGNRTPALHTSYIDNIAEALCDGLDREYKKATRTALLILLGETEESLDEAATLQNKVRHFLRESLVYTLSLDSESRKNRKQSEAQAVVSKFLEITHREPSSLSPDQTAMRVSATNHIPSVLPQKEAILSAAITLLKSALQNSEAGNEKAIYLTFQSELDYFDGYPELHHEWQQTIIQALRSGWSVHHLCRLNKNVERSLQLVNQILAWTNYSGAYNLYYFNKYGIDYPAQEIILIRGNGVIMSYATEKYKEIDAGLYLYERGAVRVIEKYVEQMLHNTEPLIHILSQNDYFELNVSKDRKPGNHYMCAHDLSYLTVPLESMERYVRLSIPDEDERLIHWKRIEDTAQSFYRDIQHFQMRHIYPMRAIDELIRTKKYYQNPYFHPTREDIKVHLLHLIKLIQTYERFEIALIDDHKYNLIHRAQFDIKGDHTVAVGINARNDIHPKVELIAIKEGTIVNAFQEYFNDIWEQINPIYRDKESVISWLKDKLVLL